ncbi:MAG: hypothetical protein U5Q16_07900 [Gammaproteobacteria bacterium]|nr:hypothetical protein [Gammaproteobacteria bacterium]
MSWTHYQQHRNTDPWDGGALVQTPDDRLVLPDADPEEWYFSHPDQSNESADIDFSIAELEHRFLNGWTAESKLAWHRYEEEMGYYYPFGPFGAYALGDDEIYIYSYDIEREGEDLTFQQSLGGDYELFGRNHQVYGALEYREDLEPSRYQLLEFASFRATPIWTGTPTVSTTARRGFYGWIRNSCPGRWETAKRSSACRQISLEESKTHVS